MPEEKNSVARLIGLMALVGLMVGCVLVLRPFLSALAWAAILSYSTWPAYRALTERVKLGRSAAALAMVVAMFLVLGVPLILAAPTDREELEQMRGALQRFSGDGLPGVGGFLARLPLVGGYLSARWNALDLDLSGLFNMVRPYIGGAAQLALSAIISLLSGIAELLIAILLAFFFFRDGPRLASSVETIAERMSGARGRHLVAVVGAVTQGVVYGLLGTAVVQGAMTGVGFWVASIPHPVLFGVIAGVISILPVGAPLVWIPATLWLLAEDRTGWAIFMGLYGAFGISSVDNVIRPWLISRGADMPFLLTILGALGGAVAFGLLGLFLGPVLLAVGYVLIKEWADGDRSQHRRHLM